MKGVAFGSYHSFNSWGRILQSKGIKAPEPKINQIDIDGGDGVLDLTDSFGDVKYKNRSLSFQLQSPVLNKLLSLHCFHGVQKLLHGCHFRELALFLKIK